MPRTAYLIGAGLTKALQTDEFPIPLMNDFISVAATYMERDDNNVIFTTIRELHRERCFRWPWPDPPPGQSPETTAEYAATLRRRPTENIEAVLQRAGREGPTLATRVRYMINRVFAMVDDHVDVGPLLVFLQRQFAQDGDHRFISFNYDLVLDRAIQATAVGWTVRAGYGLPLVHGVTEDPKDGPPGPEAVELPAGGDDRVLLLKPHGSLSWLGRLRHGVPQGSAGLLFEDSLPVVIVDASGRVRYNTATATFQYLHLPGELPVDVLPVIVPPVAKKELGLGYLVTLREMEAEAIMTATELFVIGWSMPASDTDQEQLVRDAVRQRVTPFERVTVVSAHSGPDYFEHIADIFVSLPRALRIYNDGFAGFVNATV